MEPDELPSPDPAAYRRTVAKLTGLGGQDQTAMPEGDMVAVLMGSASPYNWIEQIPLSGTTRTNGPRTGTGTAYEINATAGLSGRIEVLRRGLGSDWLFQDLNATPGPPCLGAIRVFIYSCASTGRAVGTVQAINSLGTVVATASPASSGFAMLAGLPMGSYTVRYLQGTPFPAQDQAATLSVCAATVNASVQLKFARIAGVSTQFGQCFGPAGASWSISGSGSYTASGTVNYNAPNPSVTNNVTTGPIVAFDASIPGTYTLYVDGIAAGTETVSCSGVGLNTLTGTQEFTSAKCPPPPGFAFPQWPGIINLTLAGPLWGPAAGSTTMGRTGPTSSSSYLGGYQTPGSNPGDCIWTFALNATDPDYCSGYNTSRARLQISPPTHGPVSGFCFSPGPAVGFYDFFETSPPATCHPWSSIVYSNGAGSTATITGL